MRIKEGTERRNSREEWRNAKRGGTKYGHEILKGRNKEGKRKGSERGNGEGQGKCSKGKLAVGKREKEK